MTEWWVALAPVLEVVRTVNPALALVGLMLLGYRVGETALERPKRDRWLGLVFLGYVGSAGLGALQGRLLDSPVGPVTALNLTLHVSLIALMVAWPRLLPDS